jgi:hypothetical protein
LLRYGPRRVSLEEYFLEKVGSESAEAIDAPVRADAAERAARPASGDRPVPTAIGTRDREKAR